MSDLPTSPMMVWLRYLVGCVPVDMSARKLRRLIDEATDRETATALMYVIKTQYPELLER